MKVELPGAGQHWGVDALEDGGALVHRWKAGSNQVSSAIYTYLVDAAGAVVGYGKRAFGMAGYIPRTLKP